MNLPVYLGLLRTAEETMAGSLREVASAHTAEADVHQLGTRFSEQCDRHVHRLTPVVDRYGERPQSEPERLHADGLSETRSGPVGLLRDLHDLHMLAGFLEITWRITGQAARATRDAELLDVVTACEGENAALLAWLSTRMDQTAPQALVA